MFSANTSQVSEDRLYVEDVFSTYLYTGNGGAQTITNGIDLAGKGGLVWFKSRSGGSIGGAYSHYLWDTSRGTSSVLLSNDPRAAITGFTDGLTSFNANGFSISSSGAVNETSTNYASWSFREAPKFFDVVTYTGDGSSNRTISHALGATPGCIIVKRTDSAGGWVVYHRGTSVPNNTYLTLQTTNAATNLGADRWSATSTTFNANDSDLSLNTNGATYVAYLFAHDTTSDGIIQCGSFTTDGSGNATVNLGWEPQWLMAKCSSLGGSWVMTDIMRGMTASGVDATLLANSANAEGTSTIYAPTATGFTATNLNGSATYVYIAIRRGPMRTPTSGTSVFQPIARAGTGVANLVVNTTVRPDMVMINQRNNAASHVINDRLRGGGGRILYTETTDAETNTTLYTAQSFGNASYTQGTNDQFFCNQSYNYIDYAFTRAPSFFDEVCYTGTGAYPNNQRHNLGVVPEMVIFKKRNGAADWVVFHKNMTGGLGGAKFAKLNSSAAEITATGGLIATSSQLGIYGSNGSADNTNDSGGTYVSYLFASAPGVSKVGSYTGNGSSQTINCGFAAGARFVMIKRIDSTGDWYVWDSARGIVSGNDPHLSLNSTAAEVTTDDSVDTDSSGFVVNQLSATNINVSSATYIYLAVA